MKLPASGREYAVFPLPEGVQMDADLTVSFDGGATWHKLSRPDAHTARILVAGPQATENPADTVILPKGTSRALVRLTENHESVIRAAGTIFVVTP